MGFHGGPWLAGATNILRIPFVTQECSSKCPWPRIFFPFLLRLPPHKSLHFFLHQSAAANNPQIRRTRKSDRHFSSPLKLKHLALYTQAECRLDRDGTRWKGTGEKKRSTLFVRRGSPCLLAKRKPDWTGKKWTRFPLDRAEIHLLVAAGHRSCNGN